jgi:hypothetical protein
VDWKIYYDDDSTFSSEDGSWEAAPSDGVLCVVVKSDKVGRHVFSGSEYYFRIPGTDSFAHADDLGPFLRKLGLVKFGRWAPDKCMEEALKKVRRDPEIPRASATDPFHDKPYIR